MELRKKINTCLNSSVSDFTDFSGVKDLPILVVEGFVKPPCCFWACHVHKPVTYIAFVTVSTRTDNHE